jgi:hypothetical protein
MEKEFIKCEVNFRLKDGDVMTGERKVVRTANVGDYVERKSNRISPTLWRGAEQSYGGAFHVEIRTA